MDVLAPDGLVIDEVTRLPVAGQHALDRHFGIDGPGAAKSGHRIVENQLDTGPPRLLALGRAIEDHVLHRLAAQLGRPRLAEHPPDGVHDVGFAAAVGADHADQLARHLEGGRIDE